MQDVKAIHGLDESHHEMAAAPVAEWLRALIFHYRT